LGEIAARTDGVPLFVEELTKAVLEAGAAGAGAVPVSLHASLMARLDRVPGVREVAQAAACIGREFAYPLLAAVSALPEAELRAALERLAAAELVFARASRPRRATRSSTRWSGTPPTRACSSRSGSAARAHRRALEERFPETADAEPELLARHCAEAGLAEQAVDHWRRPGSGRSRARRWPRRAQLTAGQTVRRACRRGRAAIGASSACSSRSARRRSP
jgi:hypothetical protein